MTQAAKASENPLLADEGLPRFDLLRPEHVQAGVGQVLSKAKASLEKLERELRPTWDGLLEPLEELGRPFEHAWQPVGHLLGVKNSEELRKAHEAVLPEVVGISLRMRQSQAVHDALQQIRSSSDYAAWQGSRKRIVEDKLRDAHQAGVGLQGAERDRFNQIELELSQLQTDFSNHVLDATKAYELVLSDGRDAEGLPQTLRQLASQSYNQARGVSTSTAEKGPWRITLDPPVFTPFMQHCRNRSLREQVYRAYIARAGSGKTSNVELITRILKLRQEKARLLGYPRFAELSLASKMAPSVQAVHRMFDELSAVAMDHARKDMDELRAFVRAKGELSDLAHWDLSFWTERLREERFGYTDEQLRPYFPMPRVLEGLFSLCEKLFGIKVLAAEGKAPIWHEDVRYFEVLGETGQPIAGFYLDAYSRPKEKRGGAWMDVCLSRRKVHGKLQLPVAHLCCNGTPPVGSRPSLMSFREVETLFHEFGHGLQHMLTTVDDADAAGLNCIEWDAVELASQFMENWCYHEPTLLGLSAHVDTGEPLPAELFAKIKASRTFRAGSMIMRQVELGLTDMLLHEDFDPQGKVSAFDLWRDVASRTGVLAPLPENRFLCSFTHIFSGAYAAGYYSYKWSEVLSADAFAAFEEAGLEDARKVAALGRRFRDTVLALGGSMHPMEVFREFRGREPSTQALLRHAGMLA